MSSETARHAALRQGLTALRAKLDVLAPETATREDLDELAAEVRGTQVAAFGPRPRARPGEGAIWKMLEHLKHKLGQPVHGEELAALGGIGEWARRLRELRVEHGYDIEHVGGGHYKLHFPEPNRESAERWQLANAIRNSGGSAKARVDAYFRANVGRVVRRDQIDYVAKNVKEGTRRLRELRDEEGWPILSRIDEPSLGTGEYLLLSDDPADFREPHQRDYPDAIRKAVFERDEYRCQECGRNREDALREGDTRFFLEIDHVVGVADPAKLSDAERSDPANLRTVCHRDHARKTAAFQREQRVRRAGPR